MSGRRVQADTQPVRQTDRGTGRALRLEQTSFVRVETVIDDDAPDPAPPNRATRRALKRAARRTT